MNPHTTRLYLPSLGIVSPLGANKNEVVNNLFSGSQKGMVSKADLLINADVIVGEVSCSLPEIDDRYAIYKCRNNQLTLAALAQISDEVDNLIDRYGKDRIAVVLGSSTAGIREGESALAEYLTDRQFPEEHHYRKQEMGSVAEFLALYLGLTNIAITISTACSSSGKVFSSAKNYIQAGICDAAIVGGIDSLCKLTLNGFSSLESVSAEICNPFSHNRSGITIGEGAALFILDKHKSEIQLLGTGESSDAHHMSAPHPEGDGAENAMRAALLDANLDATQIDYVNLHGTATPKNDDMESKAMHRVFGSDIPCSSTKPMTGHTLGAAGAIELAHCWLTLSNLNKKGQLPPHIWDHQQDESLQPLNLVESAATENTARVMSNSFAFGGNNVSIILGKA